MANLPENIKVGIINVSVGGCKIELFDKTHYESYVSIVPGWMKGMIKEYKSKKVPLLAAETVDAHQGVICAGMNRIIATLPQTIKHAYVLCLRLVVQMRRIMYILMRKAMQNLASDMQRRCFRSWDIPWRAPNNHYEKVCC